ncbi:DUF2169 family type VI secretion system accessory protein [Parachitinimonas caeni]|uniref:DUF2169 domain-containing protein n=1 Tax=Parachitinimonas caeni TaxID=3031301 RepID=A0ABT7E3M9_9NEIS|nr:DUF2169 domain-containing protein [Parachitinimonas caeni]MDK2126010.1 DUF2169 domain-containing protein [Parachitinimonas caeni]
MEFSNLTPFPAMNFAALDQNDNGFEVVVARFTFDLQMIDPAQGLARLVLADEQSPLLMEDQYYGEPNVSTLRAESDLAPFKPKCDLIVVGHGHAPQGKPQARFQVGVQLGSVRKVLSVCGPRSWKHTLGGWVLSEPEPVSRVPLRYEYAYGGDCQSKKDPQRRESYPYNPLGRGFHPAWFIDEFKPEQLPAPQIESPQAPLQRFDQPLPPEGFGAFGKAWQPRLPLAGSYDAQWVKERHPFLPENFNFAYWNGAHPDLQLPYPRGDEDIVLANLLPADTAPSGLVRFCLTGELPFVFFTTGSGLGMTRTLQLDTLLIDCDQRKVYATYRLALSETLEIRQIELRHLNRSELPAQIARAEQLSKDPQSRFFIPLPPEAQQVRAAEMARS